MTKLDRDDANLGQAVKELLSRGNGLHRVRLHAILRKHPRRYYDASLFNRDSGNGVMDGVLIDEYAHQTIVALAQLLDEYRA